ncbi:calcium/proton exchanger [Panus rudis PR-1116 ss-1]|nr:calcium/proton exchanger [Panus rudis PR-1116 ss-1]
MNLLPEKPVAAPKAPGVFSGLRAILTASWLNVLLVCIPVSWALRLALPRTDSNDTITFVFAFLAIIPLAKLLAFATDELSMRVGQTLAGLLNATLIIALVHCELQVVQSSLVGSILSNLLLVLGMCFFAGGTRFSEQGFGVSSVQLNSTLLTISVIAILLPAAFHFVAGADIVDSTEGPEILSVSHGVAIILLFIYGCYLVFQLFSHKGLYEVNETTVQPSVPYSPRPNGEKAFPLNLLRRKKKDVNGGDNDLQGNSSQIPLTPTGEQSNYLGGDVPRSSSPSSSHSFLPHRDANTDVENGVVNGEASKKKEEEEEEVPTLSVWMTIALLGIVTALIGVTAEFLVDSIDGLVDGGGISKEFVGIILLPIVGNAAEHVTAVTVSVKNKLTLSLGVAVGSSIQIALFVIPLIVVLGWIIGKPMTLLFDPFESIVMFFAVIVVNYTVQDGKSNWLEGMILMCLYVILAVVFWYYPGTFLRNCLSGRRETDGVTLDLNIRCEYIGKPRTLLDHTVLILVYYISTSTSTT